MERVQRHPTTRGFIPVLLTYYSRKWGGVWWGFTQRGEYANRMKRGTLFGPGQK